jgi:hypothetical protein
MAVSPPKVKIEKNPRVKKIKRPKEESAAISKDVDTGELGLGE